MDLASTASQTALALHWIDFAFIAIYFFAVMGIGIWVAKRTETGDDLFLAGRSLGWKPIGFSLFASNISSTTLIGLAGAAYATGIAVSAYEWMAAIILIFMAIVVMPLYLKAGITTIPEFLERRFNRASRKYFSAITIILSILVDTAGGLYAGAVVLQTFFPDLVLWHVTLVLALVAGLYTAIGGLKAVVYTDVIQAVILIIGSTALTLLLFQQFDYSWANVVATTPEGHFSMIKPIDDATLPWPGLLLGVPILGFWYWATNQYITQRVLGARDLGHARSGALLGGALKLLPLFIMVIPGAMAISLYPDLPKADMVFPTLVANELPIGMTGLVLAGLVAAIMSSIDSTLNSASTLIVCDFVERPGHHLTPEKAGKIGRLTTIILMLVAAAWAPMIANMGGLFDYLQQAFSILVPPVAAVFIMGYFWRRATGKAAFKTLITGHVLGVLLFALGQDGLLTEEALWPLHFTLNVVIMTALSAGLFYVFSMQDVAPDPAQVDPYTWTKALAEPEVKRPLVKNYLFQSAVVFGLTVLMLVAFW